MLWMGSKELYQRKEADPLGPLRWDCIDVTPMGLEEPFHDGCSSPGTALQDEDLNLYDSDVDVDFYSSDAE
jgi:hypothetical protein